MLVYKSSGRDFESHCSHINLLSLNVKQLKYHFFDRPSKKDDIPLRLATNKLGLIKFLDVLIDKNVTFKQHAKTINIKIFKVHSLLY